MDTSWHKDQGWDSHRAATEAVDNNFGPLLDKRQARTLDGEHMALEAKVVALGTCNNNSMYIVYSIYKWRIFVGGTLSNKSSIGAAFVEESNMFHTFLYKLNSTKNLDE